jgi:protein-tyrosine phosphatase
VTSGEQQTPAARVLLVCTANQCRSPLAGALLAAALATRGVTAEIETAGLASAGYPATEPTVTVAARLALDLSGHRSRLLTPTAIESADLVLGMERFHVREVVVTVPAAWPRVFTLKEFVRRAGAVGRRRADERVSTWIELVHDQRHRLELLGESSVDDLSDPTGGTLAEHEDTVRELGDLITGLVELGWPLAETRTPPSSIHVQ